MLYSTPVNITTTTTIKAYAVKAEMIDSAVVSFTYTINLTPAQVDAPTASPIPGTFDSAVSVSLGSTTDGAIIYYTTDGSDPIYSGTRAVYSTPINIDTTTAIKAYAVKTGMSASEVASFAYTITAPSPGFTIRLLDLQRISVNADGLETSAAPGYIAHSSEPSVNGDGRYVAFCSYANNLVVGDTNNAPDIFVKDTTDGTLVRVSVTSTGGQSNGGISDMPRITPDGRYVVFRSASTNLATGDPADDTNTNWDIFIHDRDTDGNGTFDEPGKFKTIRVSVNSSGEQTTHSNMGACYPSISNDGRFICFSTDATNLVAGDTNGNNDVFVHDRDADEDTIFDEAGAVTTRRVSVSSVGDQSDTACYSPQISGNGQYVVFTSGASTLVPGISTSGIYLHDLHTGATSWLTQGSDPQISDDGRYIASGSGNNVYCLDRSTGNIERVSPSTSGGDPDTWCSGERISPDGRFVTFCSSATNLVPDDTNECNDVFIYDRQNQLLKRLSTNSLGIEGDSGSFGVSPVSANGHYIAFTSEATNLVPDDTNNEDDVFLAIIDPDAIIEDIAPDPNQITVMNNVTGDDLVQVSGMGDGVLVKVYDAAAGGNLIAQDTSMEGAAFITIANGFASDLTTIYVSATPYGGNESSLIAKAIPIPPVMVEGTDYSVDTVDCGYGKIAYKVTAAQKAAIETSTGTVINTIKAYTTDNIETTFANLAEAEATGGVEVPAGDTGVAVAKDPGNYGYAIAAYDATNQVVAYYVSDTWETVWSGLGVSPNPVNASTQFNQTFTLTVPTNPYSAGTFKDTDLSSYVTLEGLFDGLALGAVTRISSTQITVQVTGNLSQTGYYGKICIAANAFENAPEPGGAVRQVAEVRIILP